MMIYNFDNNNIYNTHKKEADKQHDTAHQLKHKAQTIEQPNEVLAINWK